MRKILHLALCVLMSGSLLAQQDSISSDRFEGNWWLYVPRYAMFYYRISDNGKVFRYAEGRGSSGERARANYTVNGDTIELNFDDIPMRLILKNNRLYFEGEDDYFVKVEEKSVRKIKARTREYDAKNDGYMIVDPDGESLLNEE